MRLLNASTKTLHDFPPDKIPSYAILSHTWGSEEVLYEDIQRGTAEEKQSWQKIFRTCEQAIDDGYDYTWIDNCCIDKSSSAELSESINSMYAWYQRSAICYTFLADVSSDDDVEKPDSEFEKSRWFTRGFTLQELIAPAEVVFFAKDWKEIGRKSTLCAVISRITRIDEAILTHEKALESASISRRMSWAAYRNTTRPEDIAYCLMGIFSVNMPMLYGEGDKAFIRLQEEIMKQSDDHSIFAWKDPEAEPSSHYGLLAKSPSLFAHSYDVIPYASSTPRQPYMMTNRGLQIDLPIINRKGLSVAVLHCVPPGDLDADFLAICVEQLSGDQYARVDASTWTTIHGMESFKHSVVYFPQVFVKPVADIYPTNILILQNLNLEKYEMQYVHYVCSTVSLNPSQKYMNFQTGKLQTYLPQTVFRVSGGRNHLDCAILLKRPDGSRLWVLLGTISQFNVGFAVLDDKDGRSKFEALQRRFHPQKPGWIERHKDRVWVDVETHSYQGTGYSLVDLSVRRLGFTVQIPRDPEVDDSSTGSQPAIARNGQKTKTEGDVVQPKKSFWRRLVG